MSVDPSNLDPQKVWQSQKTEHRPMTIAEIHASAHRFERRVRRSNLTEYAACIIVLIAFGEMALTGGFGLRIGSSPFAHDWLVRSGSALIVLGTLIVAWQLRARASLRTPLIGAEALIDAYRAALIRRRDALRSIGVWYLGPLIPGLVVLLAGLFLHAPPRPGFARITHFVDFLVALICTLLFALVWVINQRAADRLQRQIDRL